MQLVMALMETINEEIDMAKWNEAQQWSHTRINWKKHLLLTQQETAPRPRSGPKQEETGISLLPVENVERPDRRTPY